MWYTRSVACNRRDIPRWYDEVSVLPVPKLISGLRGTGKSASLEYLYNKLRSRGVPRKRVLFVDSASLEYRRILTGEAVVTHILRQVAAEGEVHLFFSEATELADPEFVLATFARLTRFRIVATSSSRRLLTGNLRKIYHVEMLVFDVLPPAGRHKFSVEASRALWNEIFLKDVLANCHVLEVQMIDRVAGWLSDNLGDMISLRLIANAIAPAHRSISPHTIGSYLDALVDANLVCKAVRWDTEEDAPLSTGYRYYFSNPDLRLAQYGPAPWGERRRMALNRAWLWLRHEAEEVYSASGLPEVDFVTRNGNVHAYWHVDVDGDGAVVRLD